MVTRQRFLPALLAVGVLTACGSTVQLPASTGSGGTAQGGSPGSSGDGLGAPPAGGATGTDPGDTAANDTAAAGAPSAGAAPDGTGGGGGPAPAPGTPGEPGAPAAGGQPGGPPPGAAQQPAPQGAAEQRPVQVGILYVNNDAESSAGIDNGNTYGPRQAFEGLVKAYNGRGGLAGRRVEPVYAEVKSSSSSYAADLAAACAKFTQDNQVALVLSIVAIYREDFTQCLTRAGVSQISGDYALGDDQSLRAAPPFFGMSALTTDDRARLKLERLAGAGRLRPDDKIGVIVEGCPPNERTYSNTVEPVAGRLGLTIEEKVVVRCFNGLNDLGGQSSDLQNAVLRFQSKGITQVTFVSGGAEANLFLLFAGAAESQGYRPGYALTSVAAPVIQEQNAPKAQLANAAGLGWLPTLDTTRSADMRTEPQVRCLKDLQDGAGVTPQSPLDRYLAFGACDTMALSDAVLRRTRGATAQDAFAAGVQSLGSGFTGAVSLGGSTEFAQGRRTGPAQGRLFAFSAGCGCFDYTGEPFSLVVR